MALQRFYNATDKLVNAFIMGTIKHGECDRCAVGTLCNGDVGWSDAFNGRLGYNKEEISNIEVAYEGRMNAILEDFATIHCSDLFKHRDPDSFIGLCRVFDYMVGIEDWHEEEKGANIFELLTLNN